METQRFNSTFQGECIVLINPEEGQPLPSQQQVCISTTLPCPKLAIAFPPPTYMTHVTARAPTHRQDKSIGSTVRTPTQRQRRIGCAGGSSTAMSLGATMSVSRSLSSDTHSLCRTRSRISTDSASCVNYRSGTFYPHI